MSFDGAFSEAQTHHRLSTPLTPPSSIFAVYGILLSILVYFILQSSDVVDLCLQHIWNALVHMTPGKLNALFDKEHTRAQLQQDEPIGFNSGSRAEKSNVLRRILRIENGGFMQAVQRTGTLSNLRGIVQRRQTNSPPGLGNWDSSCYQNSVLQGLASLTALPPFLDSTGGGKSDSTTFALKDLFSRLSDKQNRGRTFWTPAKLKNMSSWQQQDAQEYFSKVLDEVDKDSAQALKSNPPNSGGHGLAEARSIPARSEAGGIRGTRESRGSNLSLRSNELPEELQSIIVRNPLEGLLAQRVGCQRCGYVEGLSLVPFTCLTLPLGKEPFYDIRECLDEFTDLEPIDGVECVKCTLIQAEKHMIDILETLRPPEQDAAKVAPKTLSLCDTVQQRLSLVRQSLDTEDYPDNILKRCQIGPKNRVSTTKSRQAVIARAPKALALHVNRSEFNELTGVQSKNYAKVRFSTELHLGMWYLGDYSSMSSSGAGIEEWNTNPSISMLASKQSRDEGSAGPRYQLRAVVTHYGRHENGHYICYRQSVEESDREGEADPDAKESLSWWRLSDEDVAEVSQENVLAQGGVFMLFYEQVEHRGVSDAPAEAANDSSATSASQKLITPEEHPGSATVTVEEPEPNSERAASSFPTSSEAEAQLSDTDSKGDVRESATRRNDSTLIITPDTSSFGSISSFEAKSELKDPDARMLAKLSSASAQEKSSANALPTPPTPPATPKPLASPRSQTAIPKLSPRSGRGSVDDRSSTQTMGSFPGFVQAN